MRDDVPRSKGRETMSVNLQELRDQGFDGLADAIRSGVHVPRDILETGANRDWDGLAQIGRREKAQEFGEIVADGWVDNCRRYRDEDDAWSWPIEDAVSVCIGGGGDETVAEFAAVVDGMSDEARERFDAELYKTARFGIAEGLARDLETGGIVSDPDEAVGPYITFATSERMRDRAIDCVRGHAGPKEDDPATREKAMDLIERAKAAHTENVSQRVREVAEEEAPAPKM